MSLIFDQKVLKALKFASVAHKQQSRKDSVQSPYISHPAAVGLILARSGFPTDVVVAGVLHDIVEDTDFTFDDIVREFDVNVCNIVAGVTEDKSLEHADRKESYLKVLAEASQLSKAVSAADLLANRMDMLLELESGNSVWEKFVWGPKAQYEFELRRISVIRTELLHPLVLEAELMVEKVHSFSNA